MNFVSANATYFHMQSFYGGCFFPQLAKLSSERSNKNYQDIGAHFFALTPWVFCRISRGYIP